MKTKTFIFKSGQNTISRTLLTSLLMVIVLILSGLNLSAQSFILNLQGETLSFTNAQKTIVVNTGNSGTNVGSIHKYTNVITKDGIVVYAKMKVIEKVNANITNWDDDVQTGDSKRFQPRIGATSNSGGYVAYELEFFNAADDQPVFVFNYSFTAIDIDGNGANNREYIEVGGYTTYAVNVPTGLTISTNNTSGRTRFLGITYSLNGLTFENSAAFIANYTNANNKITFALGQNGQNTERFYSVQIGISGGVFSDPVIVNNPLPVAIDDVGTPVNSSTGGTAVNNVLDNDLYDGNPINLSQVNITLVDPPSNSGIKLNTSSGKVTVDPGTPGGTYTFVYKICMKVRPSDCDIATVTVKVLSADLTVVKTADNAAPYMGSNVTFTITATNNGPDDATNVVVNDQLPSGYTFVSATPSFGTWSSPNWTIGNLAKNASQTLTVVATVKSTGVYANKATITGTQYDPNTNNNSSTSTPVPVAATDLSVVKVVNNATPVIGSNVTFTITATNNGPLAATGVKVVDALPSGYTIVGTPTATTGSYNAPNWTIGNLAIGSSAALTVVATVKATGSYANTATISGNQTDPTPSNNTSTSTPVPTAATDLAITKTVNNATPAVGTNVTFTLSVVNNGPSAATGVKVVDALPAGYTYVSNTPSTGTWSGSTWTIGALANGATATLALVATVNATGPYANSATVSGNQTDPTPGNNTGTATTVPVGAADLSITKTVNNASPNAGENVTFTLTAKNNGPSAATGVNVNDVLPSGYTFVSATPSAGTWTAPNWAIGNLANGATVTLSIVATVKASGNYDNTAAITGNQTDPVSTNNSSTATVTPSAVADLEVTKTVNNTTPDVGSTVTFTITAKNIGPSAATGVNVNDVLPAGFTFTGATASTGTWTAPNWAIGNLAFNATATLSITATVNAAGPYVNTATITGQQPDPNTANNSSQATCAPVAKADLSITKTVNNTAPAVGTNVTFTLTAKNNGPSAATGVSVNDVLPSGYTFVSATPSAGTWTAPSWTIGNLANGATVTLNIVATILATGSYANTATISGTTSDPNPANNSSTVTPVPAASADVAIVKSVNNSNPSVGNNVIFTLTATNNGPSNAANVKVTDVLPSGYTFVAANPSGSWSAPIWTIGTLNNGETKTLTIEATVKATGSYVNTATIATTTTDPNMGNNTSTVTPGPSAAADLSVTKTVSNETPTVGTNVTFTITATNNGPSSATNVKVNDILPAGYTFVSFSPATSNWTAPNWTIGNLANGASTTLNIVAKVNATGPYVNTATISGTETDPNMGNNSNSATCVPVSSADLSIVKTVDNATPTVGNNVTFTLTASNIGPSNATNVKVVDLLPAGYSFVSASPSTGSWTAPNWTIGNLNSGSTATLIMVAKVNVTGPYANTATISGDQTDPNTDNNTSTITPGPAASADLGVLKTVDVATPKVNDTVTFTITATNNGLSNATLVKVTDALPAGYTFVSATPSVGTWTAPIWTIGNLAKDANATLKIKAKVKADGPYANTATIDGNETDPVDENNSSTATITPTALVGPTAIDDNAATIANTPVEIIVLTNDQVGDAALNPTTVTLIATTAPNPSTVGVFTVDPLTGVVTFTPVLGFTGIATIDYQVCDMNNLCDIAKITVSVIQGADILYPATGFGTLAFEDLWPGKGDYDFNDLVLDYQFKVVINAYNKVENVTGTFIIQAFGASYENGFGFQLSDVINSSDLTVTGYELSENFITLGSNGTESGQSKPTIIVYDNAYKQMEHPGIGIGVNTTPGAPYVTPDTLVINIVFKPNTYSINDLDISNFNPFLIVNKVRNHEVHLPYYPPTDLVNPALFGQYEDNSNPATNRYYVTDTNLPWAINIYEKFDYPQEKQEVLWAHLKFAEWATSGGVQFPDWYKNITGYRNQSLIYQKPTNP